MRNLRETKFRAHGRVVPFIRCFRAISGPVCPFTGFILVFGAIHIIWAVAGFNISCLDHLNLLTLPYWSKSVNNMFWPIFVISSNHRMHYNCLISKSDPPANCCSHVFGDV